MRSPPSVAICLRLKDSRHSMTSRRCPVVSFRRDHFVILSSVVCEVTRETHGGAVSLSYRHLIAIVSCRRVQMKFPGMPVHGQQSVQTQFRRCRCIYCGHPLFRTAEIDETKQLLAFLREHQGNFASVTFLRGIYTVYCKFVCRCSLEERLRKRRCWGQMQDIQFTDHNTNG